MSAEDAETLALTLKALADPAWDQKDIIGKYWETNALVGGPKMYLPGPGARPYGIPFGAETGVLAYRTDILEKHKITVPKTYDELLKACHVVKDKEGIGGLTSRGQTAGHPDDGDQGSLGGGVHDAGRPGGGDS